MDDEMLKRLTDMGATEEDLQNPEKVKELAEKIEAENKANAGNDAGNKDDKILNDQLGRLRKALSKGAKSEAKAEDEPPNPSPTLSELDVDNRVFIKTKGLSDKQIEVLNEYSKLPKHEGKTFETIFNSSAVQAEMKDLQAKQDAEDELDANADEGKISQTKNELYQNYKKTGETPKTEHEHKVVVEKSLKEEGFREY